MSRAKPLRLWAGIVNGAVHIVRSEDSLTGAYIAIFLTKDEAEKRYECVVPVKISFEKSPTAGFAAAEKKKPVPKAAPKPLQKIRGKGVRAIRQKPNPKPKPPGRSDKYDRYADEVAAMLVKYVKDLGLKKSLRPKSGDTYEKLSDKLMSVVWNETKEGGNHWEKRYNELMSAGHNRIWKP